MINIKLKEKIALLLLVMFFIVGGGLIWLKTRTDKQTPVKTAVTSNQYEVQPGDTLFKIAIGYKISVEELKVVNQLPNYEVKVGQRLYIPQNQANVTSQNAYLSLAVVNVYKNPHSKSETVTQALAGEEVRIINQRDKWVEISLPDQFNYQGWVELTAIKKISIDTNWNKPKIIAVSSAELYTAPRKDAEILEVLPMGTVIGYDSGIVNQNFTSVVLADGRKGYILTTKLLDYTEKKANQVTSDRLLATARQLLGHPYVWGGMTTSGVDCSGFVHTVFKVQGIKLHRDADLQFYNDGVPVSQNQLKPGDLIFFQTYKPGPSHMGIYAGNDKFIHASRKSGVDYGSLKNPYFAQRYLGAKRVINSQ